MPPTEGPPTDTAQWREESRSYRVRPGVGWWVALLVVPLLLAVIGWAGFSDREVAGRAVPGAESSASPTRAPAPANPGPSVAAPSSPAAVPPAASNLPFGPFSIKRTTDGFVLGGKMPDEQQKASLLEAIAMGLPGAVVTDQLSVDPGIRVPDIALLGGVFGVTGSVSDFSLVVDRGTLTLTGRASVKDRATAESAAADAWPGVRIVNDLRVA